MMTIYETEYGNFSRPEDLLRYMKEEGIKEVHITAKLCLDIVGQKNMGMTIEDVERWVDMGNE